MSPKLVTSAHSSRSVARTDMVTQSVHQLDKFRLECGLQGARPGKMDAAGEGDVSGPWAHDVHNIGKVDGLAQFVSNQNHGALPVKPQLLQYSPKFFSSKRIERPKRLIQQ